MSKTKMMYIGEKKEMKLEDGLFVRFRVIERELACLYLQNKYDDIIEIPRQFVLRDITYKDDIIDKGVLMETQAFSLLCTNTYEIIYKGINMAIIRPEWSVRSEDGWDFI